ncbi:MULTISPECIES: helix-turn-helix transcriptional regulator [unclassified Mesorhizobium]|uniref:helix-turn-helix transcriptional regulator n=1 Tax=unclassified Mesorhizobium TaxID=325217 RepID=UPI00112B0946|nr:MULTISPECIES: helix-turn-helix transcriptional regulator [unclassified Mesorhizobium]TPJ40630.1 helix-turn-helix domain-containing protein [Mesorhizobium sp. B2-6-6]MBZ9895648.1 helix-turn-helix transcriptional regulator [Mesorhizobium sp. BR1-1-6]MCA0000143.1 helix-turn-helix transcriptional regulator [Mesorhizobium sp. B264B2A]MCA0006194.1 helix-turn-helix transcriptional regulator [Mesorhizobium sp. B264B1B]MCA0017785.1 helix-turn-helix transcriptional regulator [Mesorhizobium sp. B264B1
MDLLTTSEAADYLRIGERKLYELIAEERIPCSKVAGKWLFPRHELDRWVMSGLVRPAGMTQSEPPPIVGGSQDDLLEWALRQSGSGLAFLTEGTEAGVTRLLRGEVSVAAIHFHSPDPDPNVTAIATRPRLYDAVLVGFARREQGLLLAPGNPKSLNNLTDVLATGARIAVRQRGAGADMLLTQLLADSGAKQDDVNRLEPPCLTGPDLAAAVRIGRADCGIATRAAARAAGLDFVPLAWESFDLLMRQRTYFQQPIQALLRLLGQEIFASRAAELGGYDPSPAGQIRFFK